MKNEVGSAKWVARRMKMKGLQSTKWYCQLCAKQCRDEHGYKLHMSSPSHSARQNGVYSKTNKGLRASNGGKYADLSAKAEHAGIDNWSSQFESGYVAILRASPRKPLSANKVYNEFIMDRDHVHMNATRWKSLTSFIKHLEDKGVVQIKWFEPELTILYIDREYELRKEREDLEKKKRAEMQATAQKLIVERKLEAARSQDEEPSTINTERMAVSQAQTQEAQPNPSNPLARPKIGFSLKKK